MSNHTQIISSGYLAAFNERCEVGILHEFQKLRSKIKFTPEDFEYYLIASSLYSSKIEGNTLDVNSFFRNRNKKSSVKRKDVQEIEDLIKAYEFASAKNLNKTNFLKVHGILSKAALPTSERGKIRKEQVGIRDSVTMKPVYLAVEPEFVNTELSKLFADIKILLARKLSYREIFYYASMVHLWVVKIHPFTDGNGRIARLTEKWFLASKLGIAAWSINSEKYYWDNRTEYYEKVALGYNYYALYWERSIEFALMLPRALYITARS